jgi:hypothetical protein
MKKERRLKESITEKGFEEAIKKKESVEERRKRKGI